MTDQGRTDNDLYADIENTLYLIHIQLIPCHELFINKVILFP